METNNLLSLKLPKKIKRKSKKSDDLFDLDQSIINLKKNSQQLYFIKEICVKSIKICQFVMQEFVNFSPIEITDNSLANLRNFLNEIIGKSLDSVQFLHEDILEPIEVFLAKYNLRIEKMQTEGKGILDEISGARKMSQDFRSQLIEISQKLQNSKSELEFLIEAVEKGDTSLKSKIEISSSIFL